MINENMNNNINNLERLYMLRSFFKSQICKLHEIDLCNFMKEVIVVLFNKATYDNGMKVDIKLMENMLSDLYRMSLQKKLIFLNDQIDLFTEKEIIEFQKKLIKVPENVKVLFVEGIPMDNLKKPVNYDNSIYLDKENEFIRLKCYKLEAIEFVYTGFEWVECFYIYTINVDFVTDLMNASINNDFVKGKLICFIYTHEYNNYVFKTYYYLSFNEFGYLNWFVRNVYVKEKENEIIRFYKYFNPFYYLYVFFDRCLDRLDYLFMKMVHIWDNFSLSKNDKLNKEKYIELCKNIENDFKKSEFGKHNVDIYNSIFFKQYYKTQYYFELGKNVDKNWPSNKLEKDGELIFESDFDFERFGVDIDNLPLNDDKK